VRKENKITRKGRSRKKGDKNGGFQAPTRFGFQLEGAANKSWPPGKKRAPKKGMICVGIKNEELEWFISPGS